MSKARKRKARRKPLGHAAAKVVVLRCDQAGRVVGYNIPRGVRVVTKFEAEEVQA